MITSIIFFITYGKMISSMDDEYVVVAEMAAEGGSKALMPGAYWVEFMPFLRYLPSWVPGTSFRALVDEYAPYVIAMRDKPFADVQAAIVSSLLSITSPIYSEVTERRNGAAVFGPHPYRRGSHETWRYTRRTELLQSREEHHCDGLYRYVLLCA